MIRALTWLTTFGIPALALWQIAPALLVPVGLLAAHAWAQRGTGQRAPDWLDRA